MKTLLKILCLLPLFSFAQPSSEGMYFDGVDDFFTVPGTSNINSTTTNNRTYEMYFKVTNTSSRQVIMEEGGGTRAVVFYVENGYLVVGAYNRNDYTPRWEGTFYRKAISANTWYHFAFVFDNAQPADAMTNPMTTTANNALKWYLDGVLQDEISGYQLGSHNATVLGYKDGGLRFPDCGTWTASGLSEYCFNSNSNDGGSGEYYFQGNLWGYRMWSDVRTLAEINDNMDTIITTVGTDNLVAALDGDTFTYLDSDGNPADVSNTNNTEITWSATAATTDWNTGTNWVGGSVPDAAKQESAIIPSSTYYPSITSHIIAGDVEVKTGAEISIQSGGTLDVNYDLENKGIITIENNGSLLNRESKPVSGSGTYVIKRDTPDYPQDDFFSIWSTPVGETDSQIGDVFTNNIIAFKYDASQNPSTYVQVGANDDMEVGKGYFIRSDNDSGVLTRTFTGTVNNGEIEESIYFNSVTDNFNLIGNPYPSAIDWLKFQADNSDVLSGTMYFWSQSFSGVNNSASDFISFNSTGSNIPGTTGNIATAAGIFTKSTQSGTATFKNAHRVVGNNDQFFNPNNPDDGKSWFKLASSSGFSSILVGFLPDATDAYESNYDGEFVNEGANIELYSFIGTDKYAIQGLSELVNNANRDVPLGFEVATAGTYTFSIFQEYINSDFDIILDDTQEDIQTDLRLSDYTFNMVSPSEDNDRFILRYTYRKVLSVDDNTIVAQDVRSFIRNNVLISNVNDTIQPKQMEVYDVTGKKIISSIFTEKLLVNDFSSGFYIVKYTFDDSKVLTKKVLKQ